MPCYDARDHDPEAARAEGYSKAQREFTHNSPVAELLCAVLKHLQSEHSRGFVSVMANYPEVAKWWADHQERDRLKAIREREAAEKKRHNDAIAAQIKALQRKLK